LEGDGEVKEGKRASQSMFPGAVRRKPISACRECYDSACQNDIHLFNL